MRSDQPTHYQKRSNKTAHTAKTANKLDDWRRQCISLSKSEPDCLIGVDSIYGHGGRDPTSLETKKRILGIIERAKSKGASNSFLKKLSHLLLVEIRD